MKNRAQTSLQRLGLYKQAETPLMNAGLAVLKAPGQFMEAAGHGLEEFGRHEGWNATGILGAAGLAAYGGSKILEDARKAQTPYAFPGTY